MTGSNLERSPAVSPVTSSDFSMPSRKITLQLPIRIFCSCQQYNCIAEFFIVTLHSFISLKVETICCDVKELDYIKASCYFLPTIFKLDLNKTGVIIFRYRKVYKTYLVYCTVNHIYCAVNPIYQ